MSLQVRVSALATTIANYLRDYIKPNLLPVGGSTGQVATRQSGGVVWVDQTDGSTKRFRDLGAVSGDVVLDLTVAHAFSANLIGNISISIVNWSAASVRERVELQIASNGHSVVWGAPIKWPFNAPPRMHSNGKSLYSFSSQDAGLTVPAEVRSALFDIAFSNGAHWRINITANEGFPNVALQEVQFLFGGEVVGLASNIVSTNQSSFYTDGASDFRDAHWVFDGVMSFAKTDSWFSDDSGFPQWVSVQYAERITADQVKIYPTGGDLTNTSPRAFSVQTSEDGMTWATVASFTGVTGWDPGTAKVFSLI